MPDLSWINFIAILNHFMLEDAIEEHQFQTEDEGLQYLIKDNEKPCLCRCHSQEEQKEDVDVSEEKQY